MRSNKLSLVLLVFVTAFAAFSAFAQNDTFSDPNVEYTFTLPEPRWKMTVKPSATSPNVEYVYGDRVDGHFEVRKLTVAKDAIMTDVVPDWEQKVQFPPGFVGLTFPPDELAIGLFDHVGALVNLPVTLQETPLQVGEFAALRAGHGHVLGPPGGLQRAQPKYVDDIPALHVDDARPARGTVGDTLELLERVRRLEHSVEVPDEQQVRAAPRVLGDEGGWVRGLRCARMELGDGDRHGARHAES